MVLVVHHEESNPLRTHKLVSAMDEFSDDRTRALLTCHVLHDGCENRHLARECCLDRRGCVNT